MVYTIPLLVEEKISSRAKELIKKLDNFVEVGNFSSLIKIFNYLKYFIVKLTKFKCFIKLWRMNVFQ